LALQPSTLDLRTSHRSDRARQNLFLILPLLALVGFRLLTRQPPPPSLMGILMDAAGMLMVVGGLWLRVVARQWKAERAHEGLVTDGIYAYVRHPLYLGSALLGTGLALVLGDWLILLAFLAFFLTNHGLVLRAEEQDLAARFGAEHAAYRAAVPAFLPRRLHPPQRVAPLRLREAVVRESDALCIWLALPLVMQLVEWSLYHPGTPGLQAYQVGCSFLIASLALVWIRLKLEYQAMIRRERALHR
jgi:protein-S-isoprenylcysteine O-methyltransferase Ste14